MTYMDYRASNHPPLSDDDARVVDQLVGRQIRACRRGRGMTLKALAASIDVSYQQLQKYEHGINRVSAGRLYTIAAALGTDVSEFFQMVPATPRAAAAA